MTIPQRVPPREYHSVLFRTIFEVDGGVDVNAELGDPCSELDRNHEATLR